MMVSPYLMKLLWFLLDQEKYEALRRKVRNAEQVGVSKALKNRRGATFMHVEDFSGVEKTGVENSNFLHKAIKSIRPSNVLQVVTDNAANCKTAGEEALANTIVLDSWKDWAKKGDENTRKIGQVGTKMGEVYERIDNVVGEIKDVMKNVYTSYFLEVKKIDLARWEKMTIPLHYLGFALTQRFYDKTYLTIKAPGGIPRKPPNLDKEVTNDVKDY
ncbi:uncharacterized protein Tco_0848240 [Tanacetum coccineum]